MKEGNKIEQEIVAIVIFSAVSAALGLVKIPGPAGSIALDSAPAFFAALYFSPRVGALVGLIGHLASAATAGFPFGGLHVYVAIEMLLWVFVFGYLISYKKTIHVIIGVGLIAIILNGVIGPLLLTITPVFYLELKIAQGLILFLSFAASINVVLAIVAYILISKTKISNI
ncbi:MAG: ECF transporter S component [Saprospiraceae bacterium]|nr:ECF transporter S component [Saprospiraceae bacterium]